MTDYDLLAFVGASIRSVWALELLLFLKRNSARAWDADALVRELRSSAVVIAEALAALRGAGLLTEDPGNRYRYRAPSETTDQLVSDLERLYTAKPTTVINAIVA